MMVNLAHADSVRQLTRASLAMRRLARSIAPQCFSTRL